MVYHYIYKITFAEVDNIYFGVRSCECLPEKDVKYLGSPTTYKSYWSKYIPIKTILSTWPTRKEANEVEDILVEWQWSVNKELSLNASMNGVHFEFTRSKEINKKIGNAVARPFKLINPKGEAIFGTNLAEFCRENNLHYSCLNAVIRGARYHSQGYRYYDPKIEGLDKKDDEKVKHKEEPFRFVSPDGVEIETTNLKAFCKLNNLSNSHMGSVSRGHRKHHKGWKKG
jgi:hypothetical protein